MIPNEINIIKVEVLDVAQLQQISRQTFVESYSWGNTIENVQNYIETNFHENKLIEEINNPHSQFYFALLGGKLIGYFKINFAQAQTDLNDNKSIEIERIYILSEFQRMKIGNILINEVCKIAKQNQLSYVWLGVWENNISAMQFYERNAFSVFATHPFKFGSEIQTDILMKRIITSEQL